MEFKGITVGTYISRKSKNNKKKMYVQIVKLTQKYNEVRILTKKKNMIYAKGVKNAMFPKVAKHY